MSKPTTLETPADSKTTWLETPASTSEKLVFECEGPFGTTRRLELARNPSTPFEKKVLECARAGYANPQEAARAIDPKGFNDLMAAQTGRQTPSHY